MYSFLKLAPGTWPKMGAEAVASIIPNHSPDMASVQSLLQRVARVG